MCRDRLNPAGRDLDRHPSGAQAALVDACGRTIDHLRLSLTDRCNLACRYCVPSASNSALRIIEPQFAFEVVRWLSTEHHIRHVRLTGGEPLLYPHLVPLVERLTALETLHEVTLTTNGQMLDRRARPLRDAGLSRINISLDTLNPRRFAELTRGGDLARTLAGIDAAVEAGLTPIKINVVVQRGVNEEEIGDLARWGLAHGCVVRYLEVMPLGPMTHVVERHLVPAAEILRRLAERFELRTIPQTVGAPAVEYAVEGDGVRGVVGVIAPTTRPFCGRCRRLRVTARGEVVPCVHDHNRADLMPAWDGRRLDGAAANALLAEVVARKRPQGPGTQSISMVSLGG